MPFPVFLPPGPAISSGPAPAATTALTNTDSVANGGPGGASAFAVLTQATVITDVTDGIALPTAAELFGTDACGQNGLSPDHRGSAGTPSARPVAAGLGMGGGVTLATNAHVGSSSESDTGSPAGAAVSGRWDCALMGVEGEYVFSAVGASCSEPGVRKLVISLVCSFVRSFFGSFVCLFVRSFVSGLVGLLVCLAVALVLGVPAFVVGFAAVVDGSLWRLSSGCGRDVGVTLPGRETVDRRSPPQRASHTPMVTAVHVLPLRRDSHSNGGVPASASGGVGGDHTGDQRGTSNAAVFTDDAAVRLAGVRLREREMEVRAREAEAQIKRAEADVRLAELQLKLEQERNRGVEMRLRLAELGASESPPPLVPSGSGSGSGSGGGGSSGVM